MLYIGCPLHNRLPKWLSDKEFVCSAGDMGSIPGLERFPGEENGNPVQYSPSQHPPQGLSALIVGHTCQKPTSS